MEARAFKLTLQSYGEFGEPPAYRSRAAARWTTSDEETVVDMRSGCEAWGRRETRWKPRQGAAAAVTRAGGARRDSCKDCLAE